MNDKAMKDLAKRVNWDFYIGVVGSVRSGKSSFINSFFKNKVLPYIKDDFTKNKILDELPQCSEGKQIMTVEPKFIPSNSLEITIDDSIKMNVRMVDCVGKIIPRAMGYETSEGPRLVKTPWYDEQIPFADAAKIGTEKVIYNHSNLGIYITSDGTFGEFTREEYASIEADLIPEIQALNKPFVIVLNTKDPLSNKAKALQEELTSKYGVYCGCCNATQMNETDIDEILKNALYEFPIEELRISLPDYIEVLGEDIDIKKKINDLIDSSRASYKKIKDVDKIAMNFKDSQIFNNVKIEVFSPETAEAEISLDLDDNVYQNIINEIMGDYATSRAKFIEFLYASKKANALYSNIGSAIESAQKTGYGISIPNIEEMKLLPPVLVKQNGKYGVKLQAIAPSLHIIKTDVESTFTPIIGSEVQSENLIENLINNESAMEEMWNKEFFGRKLREIVNDGIKNRIYQMPDKSKEKLQDVLNKILNSNHNGLIAIIL